MKGRSFPLSSPTDVLTTQIAGLAMKVHRTLRSGFLEAVYRNALGIELRKVGIDVENHPTISVTYAGEEAGIENGLLLNFGSHSLEIRTKTRTYPKRSVSHSPEFGNLE